MRLQIVSGTSRVANNHLVSSYSQKSKLENRLQEARTERKYGNARFISEAIYWKEYEPKERARLTDEQEIERNDLIDIFYRHIINNTVTRMPVTSRMRIWELTRLNSDECPRPSKRIYDRCVHEGSSLHGEPETFAMLLRSAPRT